MDNQTYLGWVEAELERNNNELFRISQELELLAEHQDTIRPETVETIIENAAEDLNKIEQRQCQLYRDANNNTTD